MRARTYAIVRVLGYARGILREIEDTFNTIAYPRATFMYITISMTEGLSTNLFQMKTSKIDCFGK